MAEITASLVKELRDKTNAGMMDCKKALAETNGNLDEAVKYLREKGIAKAAAKADRAAKEGVITSRIDDAGATGILLEINCETDFVSKNDGFRSFVDMIADALANSTASNLEEALKVQINGVSIDETIKTKVIEIGENMMLRQFQRFALDSATHGLIQDYIHMGGKVGVLVHVKTKKPESTQTEEFRTLVKDLTLHIAAAAPKSLSSADLDQSLVAAERDIYRARLLEQGKPANMLDKILDGQMRKYYSEVCLLEQGFVKDPDTSISKLIAATGKMLGDEIEIVAFTRFQLGI